jgi:hypothetical protein
MKKHFLMWVLCSLSICLFAQAGIPDDFWNTPMKDFNPIMKMAGKWNYKNDPTPGLLFRKLAFQDYQNAEGTTIKTAYVGARVQESNIVIELKMDFDSDSSKALVYFNLDKKANNNQIMRIILNTTNGQSADQKIDKYDMNNSKCFIQISQLYGMLSGLMNMWHTHDQLSAELD